MESVAWSPAELLKLSGAYWSTCTLHAGVKLDLFTPLAAGAQSAAELAATRNIPLRGLSMLLDALTALELLTKQEDRYAATDFAASYLSRSAPGYLGHIILHHQHLVKSWSQLDEAVKSGSAVRNRVSHEATDEERESFLMGMFNLAMFSAPKIAVQIDLSGRQRLLDLGGGPGTYAIQFCLQNPELQAVIFDLPTTRPFAEQTLKRFAMEPRIAFRSGDFATDSLPGRYDVVWLSHVLHSEGPQECAQLLSKAAAVLEPGGLLLVQEFILHPDRTGPLFPALFSLNMLTGTPQGQAYSEPQLKALLQQAGLTKVERLALELPNGAGVMAATKFRRNN